MTMSGACSYVGKEAELLGCRKIRYAINGPPNVEELVIQDLDDIAKLEIPDDITAHPAFQEELKCLSLLKREVGGRYPICAYVSSSMTLPAMLMGMDKWFELLLLGPAEPRDELLAKCHAFFVKEVEAYRALGADVLMYSNPFGSTDTVPMGVLHQAGSSVDREGCGRRGHGGAGLLLRHVPVQQSDRHHLGTHGHRGLLP